MESKIVKTRCDHQFDLQLFYSLQQLKMKTVKKNPKQLYKQKVTSAIHRVWIWNARWEVQLVKDPQHSNTQGARNQIQKHLCRT